MKPRTPQRSSRRSIARTYTRTREREMASARLPHRDKNYLTNPCFTDRPCKTLHERILNIDGNTVWLNQAICSLIQCHDSTPHVTRRRTGKSPARKFAFFIDFCGKSWSLMSRMALNAFIIYTIVSSASISYRSHRLLAENRLENKSADCHRQHGASWCAIGSGESLGCVLRSV